MKDEYGGTIIREFIGPKPKMYSIRNINNCEKSVHKGHNSNIGHDEFKDTLMNKKLLDIIWKESNLLIMECIHMKVIKYHHLLSITKDILLKIE